MSRCPFAFALGIPGEGVHATRFLGIAVVDTLLTVLAAALTAWWFEGVFWKHFLGWFILGEILHWMAGTPTAVLKGLGIDRKC